MSKPRLIIGNKNYSSWSFRAWLLLAKTGLDFEEIYIPLYTGDYKNQLLQYSPAAKVPVYQDGALTIWDTLAIAEYLAELYPALWPQDRAKRAQARSIAAEMHSGFFALREAMPMNCRAHGRQVQQTPALTQDIQRILAIWNDCRQHHADEGPWLFGKFSIADAMYAPVVARFHTYGVETDTIAAAYMRTLLADAPVKLWYEAARQEKEVIETAEVG